MSDQQQDQVQDTAKKKSLARPIGGIGQYATIGGRKKFSEVQTSENLDGQTSTRLDVQQSKSIDFQDVKVSNVKKSKHPDWKQQTIYLPPELARKLKVQAALTAQELSEIVTEALTEYFRAHPFEQ